MPGSRRIRERLRSGSRDKKSPSIKLGPHCQTVRGVGETRGTAWHRVNAGLAEWFRKNFRTLTFSATC
jgi:hypothetical protein